MSSNSSLKSKFVSFLVIGVIGLIIKYFFGGDSNKSKIHEMFIDILSVFYWIFLYILIPFIVIGFIITLFQKPKEKKKYNLKDKRNIFEELKSKDKETES